MVYLYIGAGGFLGAIARFLLGRLVEGVNPTAFPWGTFTINLIGSFVLGFFLTFALERLTITPELRLGVSTGFLGAFTTFSTFMLETVSLVDAGSPGLAGCYLFFSMVLGLFFAWLGVSLARLPLFVRLKEASKRDG